MWLKFMLDLPRPVRVAAASALLLSYFLNSHSWCVAEGCGRHSYNENKEVGSGQRENGTVPVSVHLSLPQAWCKWTIGKDEVCWLTFFHFTESWPGRHVSGLSLLFIYNGICCFVFLPSSFTLISPLPLHRIKMLESSLMWVHINTCFNYLLLSSGKYINLFFFNLQQITQNLAMMILRESNTK